MERASCGELGTLFRCCLRGWAARKGRRLLAPLVAIPLLLATSGSVGAYDWFAYPPYPLDWERFGVDGVPHSRYDVEALGAAWYVNWGTSLNPPHPNGVGAIQIIRLDRGELVQDEETLSAIIQAHPGAVWRIGNEPDSIWMDNCTPEQYARAYHRVYHFVKSVDPTAKLAFGGLVQATPLRLLYLDFVWQTYRELYGEEMPVDVWTLHSFILPEVRNSWGAEIPPGMGAYAHLGMRYEIRDHDSMEIFARRFVNFRRWMADHGQRERPLLVLEYGILMWPEIMDEDGEDFSDDRVIAFMYDTFDFFLTATDPEIGYPADGNRLVQAWAWYSLDDDSYHDGEKIGEGYGGDLFTGAYTKTLTALGRAYADYVHDRVGIGPDYTDLYPQRFRVDPATVVTWGETGTVTLTLTVEVANHGREPAQGVEVQFWEGEPGAVGSIPIGAPQVVAEVPGRYEGVGQAGVTWTPPASGAYALWVVVDPADVVAETDEGNNRASQRVLVATTRVYLPVVRR